MDQLVTTDLLSESTAAGVRTITLLNGTAHPLSSCVIAALQSALDRAATDPDCRVLLITAPGHIFCAGHDLKEMAHHRAKPDRGRAFLTQLFDDCAAMMLTLARFPKPTIAMIDGIATAAGLQLAATCDLRFVSDRATFCLPGINRDGFCTTPAVGVSRAISRTHLMELLLSGEALGADWALRASPRASSPQPISTAPPAPSQPPSPPASPVPSATASVRSTPTSASPSKPLTPSRRPSCSRSFWSNPVPNRHGRVGGHPISEPFRKHVHRRSGFPLGLMV